MNRSIEHFRGGDWQDRRHRMSAFLRPIIAALAIFWAAMGCMPAAAADSRSPDPVICRIIERKAAEHGLPVAYLSRLLWVESSFDANATSPAGAAGIAQFMPDTAVERGLLDVRDPPSSITHAARFLADLTHRFGNLGLAAAAYNAGPGRLAKWLKGSSDLPQETRHYVQLVTGRPVDHWFGRSKDSQSGADAQRSCAATITEFRRSADLRWHSGLASYSSLFLVAPDGSFVSRHSARALTVTDRLAVHDLLARAAGVAARY